MAAPKQRNTLIDIFRGAGILWIVCVWHLRDYYNLPILHDALFLYLTYFVLAGYFFISGFFMGRNDYSSRQSIEDFYKKRFVRLYIPFFLACLLLLTIKRPVFFANPVSFVHSLLLISPFLGETPPTMWFVIFLLIYNIITPLLLRNSTLCKIACAATAAMSFFLLYKFGNCDSRLYKYFIAYALGLHFPESAMQKIDISLSSPIINKTIHFFSYLSLMLYLTHRFTYFICVHFHIPIPLIYLFLIISSYCVQLLYDKIAESIRGLQATK